MPNATASTLKLWPLILVNAIAMMAMNAFTVLLGPLFRALGLNAWQAGASIAVAGMLWFLLARPWGKLSDRLGRKRVIVIGVTGFALAYLLLTLSIHWALVSLPGALISFVLILLGRGAIGAFYAAMAAAATAMIADRIAMERRAAAMAALGASGAIGLVLGPSVAGWLIAGGLMLPLYVMAALILTTPFIAVTALTRGHGHVHRDATPVRLTDKRLRIPVVVGLVSMSSVAMAQVCVGFYVMDRWGLGREHAGRVAGYALTAVGLALIIAQLGVRRLNGSPRLLICRGTALATLGFLVAGFTTSLWPLLASYFVMALGMGLVFPAFPAMAANAVQAHEQGTVAGTVSAAQGVGLVVGPLVGTLLYGIAPTVPYLANAAVLAGIALWVGLTRVLTAPSTGGPG